MKNSIKEIGSGNIYEIIFWEVNIFNKSKEPDKNKGGKDMNNKETS